PVGQANRRQQRAGRHPLLPGRRLMALRCPVCKAENTQGPQCRRCKADLALLFALEEQRQQALADALGSAGRGDWPSFLAAVTRADSLRRDDETRRLLAVARLLLRDYAGAVRAAPGG